MAIQLALHAIKRLLEHAQYATGDTLEIGA
jgi:hypothetical protein